MSSPETMLVNACLKYLRLRGIPAWRNNTGAYVAATKPKRRFVRFGHRGSSDIFGVLPWDGRFLALECKVGRNRATRDQQAFLDGVRGAGAVAEVIHSLDELAAVIGRERDR